MKQPLLLLHGAISSSKQFDFLIPLLQDQFDVYVLNFPGHGGSEIPNEPFSIPLFASDVLQFLDEKKIATISIFGYSMGGYVGLYLARYYPDRIKNIFTLATKMEWTSEIAEREVAQLHPEKILEKVPAFAALLEQMHHPQDWKLILNKTAQMLLQLGKAPSLNPGDFLQIKCLAAIAIGESDKMVSQAESKQVASLLNNGQLLILPGVPHPFERASPVLIAGYMKKFFV